MATLIPRIDPSSIAIDSERLVAEALCKQLPNNCKIFHSYPWLRPERKIRRHGSNTVLREGEADFVVVHPSYGIMIIEAKGGKMFYNTNDEHWDRVGKKHDPKDPFEQAAKCMRALENQIKERSFPAHSQLPFTRARCVIFPHCEYEGSLPPGADRNILFCASDLKEIGKKIEHLYSIQPYIPPNPLTKETLDAITKALTSTFKLVPALWAEVEAQEKQLFRFTEEQIRILDMLAQHKRARISGVAGSGKTLLAMAKARTFADQGNKVLLVCYNELLANWLNDQLPIHYKDSITILNYHKLCSQWVKEAGLEWKPSSDHNDFFKTKAPELLEQATDALPNKRFDAIVVDEGQDFYANWWLPLELLLNDPDEGSFYIFYDHEQVIFTKASQDMPDLGPPYHLPTNCRNTVEITQHCGHILKKDIHVKADAPQGRPPSIIHAKSTTEQLEETIKQVKEWTSQANKLEPSQIAIITCGNTAKSSLRSLKKIDKIPLVKDLNKWKSNEGILFTSLYRFKGLETDAMIFVDVTTPDSNAPAEGFRPEHFYVGCSRAKHLLTILSKDATLGK